MKLGVRVFMYMHEFLGVLKYMEIKMLLNARIVAKTRHIYSALYLAQCIYRLYKTVYECCRRHAVRWTDGQTYKSSRTKQSMTEQGMRLDGQTDRQMYSSQRATERQREIIGERERE